MGLVLFGSEFGANLGHVYPMLRLADQLERQGHEIVFAVRNLVQSKKAIGDRPYKVVQAPFWSNPTSEKIKHLATPSYADVMARQGFGFREIFAAYLSGWCDLIDFVKPDVIIADHSPTLSMSARGRYPLINIGNGFTLPPSHLPEFPAVIAKGKPIVSQKALMDSLNSVLKENGCKQLTVLPEIFDADGQFVCTVPQLDPYDRFRQQPQVGPLEECLKPAAFPSEPQVFLYMAHEAGRDNFILESLKSLHVKATVYLRDAASAVRQKYQSDKITMLDRPGDLTKILPNSSLVIHSGGAGLSTSCLMTGRPQITFPNHSETALNSFLMARHGVALAIKQTIEKAKFTKLLEKALVNEQARANSKGVSEMLAMGNWTQGRQTVIEKVNSLMT
ncbi:glycosyltransferase [Sneathiella limimaris]|uniref:glycosyltransferase n=1 Tax=Sneathiella limimaris TaxID=1964213 RepID=UPI00146D4C9C|nr:hypothetical protein [Sneathiella limimaris]